MRAIKASSILALGFLALFAGSARADDVMNVTVPFAFVVGNHSFPAGRYEVDTVLNGNTDVFAIRSAATAASSLAMTKPANGVDPAGSRPALVFHRYENTYRLTQIWESDSQGRALTGLPAAKTAHGEAQLAPSDTYVVAGD